MRDQSGNTSRRAFLQALGALGAVGLVGCQRKGVTQAAIEGYPTVNLPFGNGRRPLVQFPQKRPLIKLTERPPQLETPFEVFNQGIITPNDAFFVRYHNANIPLSIDLNTYRINVRGLVNTPLSLSFNDLKTQFEPVELIAVHQCSGNSRGFVNPRVGGGQAGNGLMGCARWRGVRLKDVLDRAGVKPEALQLVFDGLDEPALAHAAPDLRKALDVEHARDGVVMLAYEMNGADLPMLNGYPVRLVVPGWYGTYWVKNLYDINVIGKVYDGFYMSAGYRIPDNDCACVPVGTKPARTTPINYFDVKSLITSVQDGDKVRAGQEMVIRGIAFDGGFGINEVAFSSDGGWHWQPTVLGKDYGKYAFREFFTRVRFNKPGMYKLMARATNVRNQVQPMGQNWNPSGYMYNQVQLVRVIAT